jgi:peptidoglycan/xylan/chitin deacetylase (PgdA/CDA1 family)
VISLRNGVKGAVESALVFCGGADASRRKHSSQLLVLAYHNIVPHGSDPGGDGSLHLSQSAFAEQLDTLLRTHDVIPLGTAMAQQATDAPPNTRPCVAITFDDAYAGAMTAGVTELRARGLPATVFVTPAFLGGKSFWWDVLASAATGLDDSFRKRALNEAHGLTENVLALARSIGMRETDMPAHARGASALEMTTAMGYDKLSLAAHSWNHPNLTALADAELARELARPLEWLESYGDRALPMVSYPYGLADRRVMNATRDAGYSAAFMIEGGWTTRAPRDRFAIPRLNVPAGVSRNGFVLRTSGLIHG